MAEDRLPGGMCRTELLEKLLFLPGAVTVLTAPGPSPPRPYHKLTLFLALGKHAHVGKLAGDSRPFLSSRSL